MKLRMKRALLLVAILATTLIACSEEDNPYWWVGGVRGVGSVIPDTLLLEASRDTTVEIELSTGSSQTLLVGRYGGVESVAFLKFTSLPDSSDGIERAEISFFVSGAYDGPIRLRLDAVAAGQTWDEEDIRWDTRPSAPTFLDETADPIVWESDTISTPAFRIPGNIIIGWIDDPSTNGGLRLSMAGEPGVEPDGLLEILSSEAVLDTTITIVNPPLTIFYESLTPSTHGPSEDAFVHHRPQGTPSWGEDPTWLGVGGWRTRRVLVGFDVEALRDSIGEGPTFSIAGATLLLTALETAPDTLPYADSMRVTVLAVGEEPGWEEGSTVSDSLPIESGFAARADLIRGGGPAEFGVTTLVRDWIEGSRPNGGFIITGSNETNNPEGIRFPSRSDPDEGPRLVIIVTRPAPVRLGVDP
jgi:hypothetical protein